MNIISNIQAAAASEGRVLWMFDGMRMLKLSSAVETSIPGIWACQCNSFKSFWPWWVSRNREIVCMYVCRFPWLAQSRILMIMLEYKKRWKMQKGTWWTNRSCGGKSSGAFTCSWVFALNSASSSSSFSKERSHILEEMGKRLRPIIIWV